MNKMVKFKAYAKRGFNPSVMAELVTFGYGSWSLGGLNSIGMQAVILECEDKDKETLIENLDIHIGISYYIELGIPIDTSSYSEFLTKN